VTALTGEDQADVAPHGDRLGREVHVAHGQAAPRELVTVRNDSQVAEPFDLFDAHVDRAGHAPRDRGRAIAERDERVEVRAVEHHRDVGADAGDQLVRTHLDRLRDRHADLGHARANHIDELLREGVAIEARPPRAAILNR